MVDSGAEMNAIDPKVVNDLKLPWKEKKEPYPVYNIEGTPFNYENGMITREVDHLKVFVEGKNQGITFDAIPLESYDILLGYPWLYHTNPHINWRTGQVQTFLGDAASDTDNDSTNDARSQTSIEEDEEVRRSNTEDTPQPTEKERPPKGTRHKHKNGQAQRTRRTIAFLRKTFTQMNNDLKQQKEAPPDDRLKNVPAQYRAYEKLFAEELETGLPEHSQWDHEIWLKDGTSTTFHPIYNLNEAQLHELKSYLEEMLRKGYIRISKSEAGYPVMFVPKKNGKLRLVVDYRRLNDITVKDRTPLPLINELKDRLHGMKYFTALDLKGAYNLIRIKEGHEWKTAFRTKFGLYEYLVMPFGLTNAPATFQRMINNVLREYLDVFVVCYLDDILIFSRTEEEHTEHVHRVLQALENAKLLVEPEKSHFHASEVEFLGHIISHNEIRMDPKKLSAVKDWKKPESVKEVQAFLGFANYYRKFLQNFGKLAAPLTELTKKDRPFIWKPDIQDAFDKIKDLILSEPVLKMFDPTRPIELETDASDFALGAQIGQRDDNGTLHPIAFYSHKLHGAELNYPIYDKEFLAIVQAFKEFRHYLLGSHHQVTVYTDHKNISHFATTQQLSRRQLGYAEYLAEFDYKIIHRKGSENGRADAISRRADFDTGKVKINEQLLHFTPEGYLKQKYIAATITQRIPECLTEQWRNRIRQSITGTELRQLIIQRKNWVSSVLGMITYQGTIYLPRKLRNEFIEYCHQTVKHPKKWNDDRFWDFFNENFWWKGEGPNNYLHCKQCQRNQGRAPGTTRKKALAATHIVEQGNPLLKQILEYNEQLPSDEKTDKQQVPEHLREDLVREIHEHPLHGHQGINKTLERVKTTFSFPRVKETVKKIINQCLTCKKAKARRHKPYGELQPIPVARRPWDSITMDFITKLPLSLDPATNTAYDSILVIVDRLTKFSYFIPYQEATDAEEFSYIFLRNIVSTHGLPSEIVSDRGPPFFSNFWQCLMARIGLNHKLTTAWRPQVDGQTERMNQVLETYLRCYINHIQNDWVEKLPTAQLAYNTATNESTKITPSYANFGFTPDAYRESRNGPLAPAAILASDQLKNLHEEMRTELSFVQKMHKKYYDQKRLKGPTFSEGDMVLLATKNINTKRPNKKLDYKYIGPYKVLEKISENNYKLDLPPKVRLHPIFHISLLEPTEGTIMVKTDNETEVEDLEEYEAERILDMRKERPDGTKQIEYLVKWKGYMASENTWEPPEHLNHVQRLLKNFHQRRQNQARGQAR
jgi:hypothetical protein